MPTIPIKPLSVNKAWQGKRFKTREYDLYERSVLLLLPPVEIPEGKLEIEYKFGVSNVASDYDNNIKCLQDILQKKYNFDDKRIYKATIEKHVVKKGDEFISFEIKPLEFLHDTNNV